MIGACLPFSGFLSGLGSGSSSSRGFPLEHILQYVWHTQACGLVLECDPQFLQPEEVQQTLRSFAIKAGYSFAHTVLELSHQWASKRAKWWVVLLPIHLPSFSLPAWPRSREPWLVQHVLPDLPIWPQTEEENLEWNAAEKAAYGNAQYGSQDRTLEFTAAAPTAQHSWGNALHPCPCSCRQQPISDESLRLIGLSGMGFLLQYLKKSASSTQKRLAC